MYHLPDPLPCRDLKRIAVLTSGGDAPGMNAAIRAIVRTGLARGLEVFGIYRGYSGLITGDIQPMSSASVANILQRGGTVLKSDRCEVFRKATVRRRAAKQLRQKKIEALVVIGGDGSLSGARLLEQETGVPVIGLPGTIDNDIPGSEDTIGFDTAVNTALEAIDRIRDTADSHERLFLVEVMGRNSGFIATLAGIAGGAEFILVPDRPFEIAEISDQLEQSRNSGKVSSSLLLVAEGPEPGITQRLAKELESRGHQPRVCILGHTQRGGAPTGHDRVLASCLGSMAVDFLLAGYSDVMLGIQRQQVVTVPLDEVIRGVRGLDTALLDLARRLKE